MKRLFFILMCITTTNVFAQDGVFEINQLCVDIGCFAGDDPGLPVEITQRGSYRLTSDVMVSSALQDAININADLPVTLDLNGFGLQGITTCSGGITTCTPTGSGRGVEVASGRGAIVIKDGSIRGFGGDAIFGNIFRGTRVENVIITDNGGRGIAVESGGFFINNEVSQNGGDGFDVNDTAHLINNRVVNNGGMGTTGGICGGNLFILNDEGQEDCSNQLSANICNSSGAVVCAIP